MDQWDMTTQQFNEKTRSKVGDWECVVVQRPWDFNVSVYLLFTGNGKRQIARADKGNVVLEEFKEGMVDQPFLQLPHDSWQALLQCFGGIVPRQEEIETGTELKATKYHLEDMRKLLKLYKL